MRQRIRIESVTSVTEDRKIKGCLAIKSVHEFTGQSTWEIGFYIGWINDEPVFELIHRLERYFKPVAFVILEDYENDED